jgi:hypothetical protein
MDQLKEEAQATSVEASNKVDAAQQDEVYGNLEKQDQPSDPAEPTSLEAFEHDEESEIINDAEKVAPDTQDVEAKDKAEDKVDARAPPNLVDALQPGGEQAQTIDKVERGPPDTQELKAEDKFQENADIAATEIQEEMDRLLQETVIDETEGHLQNELNRLKARLSGDEALPESSLREVQKEYRDKTTELEAVLEESRVKQCLREFEEMDIPDKEDPRQLYFWATDQMMGDDKTPSQIHHALLLLTVSAAKGYRWSQYMLGDRYFLDPESLGLTKSLGRSYYWLIKAAEQNAGLAQSRLSQLLLALTELQFGNAHIPGYSPIPMAYRWAKRAKKNKGGDSAQSMIEMLEKLIDDYGCAFCGKALADCAYKKRCSRCNAVNYCSDDCQKKAWAAGHKQDCVELESTEM